VKFQFNWVDCFALYNWAKGNNGSQMQKRLFDFILSIHIWLDLILAVRGYMGDRWLNTPMACISFSWPPNGNQEWSRSTQLETLLGCFHNLKSSISSSRIPRVKKKWTLLCAVFKESSDKSLSKTRSSWVYGWYHESGHVAPWHGLTH